MERIIGSKNNGHGSHSAFSLANNGTALHPPRDGLEEAKKGKTLGRTQKFQRPAYHGKENKLKRLEKRREEVR